MSIKLIFSLPLSLPLSPPSMQPFHGKGNCLRIVKLEGSEFYFLNFENKNTLLEKHLAYFSLKIFKFNEDVRG